MMQARYFRALKKAPEGLLLIQFIRHTIKYVPGFFSR